MQGFPSRPPPPRTARFRGGLLAFAFALGALLLVSPAARAQDAGVSTGSVSFAAEDFFIAFYGADANSAALSTLQLQQFFNQASCLCERPIRVVVKFTANGAAKAATLINGNPSSGQSIPVQVVLGDSCNATLTDLGFNSCKKTNAGAQTLGVFRQNGLEIKDWTAKDFSKRYGGSSTSTTTDGGTTDGSDCSKPLFNQNLFVLMSTQNNGTWDQAITYPISIDLQPPAVPTNIEAEPGNEALDVSWTALDSLSQSDLLGYQVLCSRDDKDAVFAAGTYKPGFSSPAILKNNGIACAAGAESASDSPLVRKDPAFVCSGLLPTASSAYRLKVLQNGIWYGSTVVAVDRALNASAVSDDIVQWQVPEPSNDFFYYYKGYGQSGPAGEAKGGFCNVAPVGGSSWLYGGGTLVALSLVVLSRRRRR